jgi:hypothetical protein
VHEAAGQRDTVSPPQSHAINPVTSVVIPAKMADVEEIEVVVGPSRARDPTRR